MHFSELYFTLAFRAKRYGEVELPSQAQQELRSQAQQAELLPKCILRGLLHLSISPETLW